MQHHVLLHKIDPQLLKHITESILEHLDDRTPQALVRKMDALFAAEKPHLISHHQNKFVKLPVIVDSIVREWNDRRAGTWTDPTPEELDNVR